MVNLEWYRTFKAIYERGTLTGAAEVLFMTQPGVSQQLNALENYMGVQLFERKPRKMLPTPYAIQLYNQIEESIGRLEEAEAVFRRKQLLNRPTLKVGMLQEMFACTLENKLHLLDMDIVLEFAPQEELLEKLSRKQLDLVICTLKPSLPNVEYQQFYTEPLTLLCGGQLDARPFHQMVYEKKMEDAEKWLSEQNWYASSHKMELIKSFWQDNFRKHPYFKPRFVIPSLGSIMQSLQHGNGLSLMPKQMCQEALNNGKLTELWQGVKTTYIHKYFAIQTLSKYMKQIEEIVDLLTVEFESKTL